MLNDGDFNRFDGEMCIRDRACTACSGFDRLSDNLKDGAEQLSDDVVIGKSNALITPYQSFEGSRTSDNDAFQATYDASVTGFDGQDILVADTNLPENECREVTIQYSFDVQSGNCQLIYISPDLEEKVLSGSSSGSVAIQLQAGANYIGTVSYTHLSQFAAGPDGCSAHPALRCDYDPEPVRYCSCHLHDLQHGV